jgi:hypothetical protein
MAFWTKPNSVVCVGDGTKSAAELFADTSTDLALTCENITLAAGSIAYVIAEGEFYVLNSADEWKSSTPAADSKSLKTAVADMRKDEVKTELKDGEEDEPIERTESEQGDPR